MDNASDIIEKQREILEMPSRISYPTKTQLNPTVSCSSQNLVDSGANLVTSRYSSCQLNSTSFQLDSTKNQLTFN